MDRRFGATGISAPGRRASVAFGGLLVLAGCASPGTPRPPSLNIPEAAVSSSVEREGDAVRVRWSASERTTDGLEVRGPMTAEVCRGVEGTVPVVCTPVLRLAVKAGANEAVDQLPSALSQGTPRLIEYRVRLLNARGKSAGEVVAGMTASGPAPASIQDVRAEGAEQGVLIRWRPDAAVSTGVVELERTRPAAREDAKKRETQLGQAPEEPQLLHLRGASDAERAGALLDRTAKVGEPYLYTLQRVQRITLEGHTLEVRSAPSVPVSVTLRDIFAPRRPTGLVAVSGSGFIDLSWKANTEPDLAGYLVYREEGPQPGNALALNRDPVAVPAFRDTSIAAGHTYRYSVTAVDLTGNRSAASDSVAETVRVP